MAIIRAQVVLARKSLLAEDAITNTLHFVTDGSPVTPDHRAQVIDAVQDMYQWWGGQGLFAPSLSAVTDAHQVKLYNLDENTPGPNDDEAGSPIDVSTFTLSGFSSGGLPPELAIVLTMSAITGNVQEFSGATRPASRRRGRIYVGPIAVQALTTDSEGEVLIGQTYRTIVAQGFADMHASLDAGVDPIVPAVYSAADGIARPVVAIQVDNAWDVQRRRGVKPSGFTSMAL